MRRSLALALGVALAATAPHIARADEPSADRIKAAADEFDQGRRAFLAKDYENAAIHFENAFRDAPRAETLRLAIRARREGKQLARAATLAAVAQEKYAGDAATAQLARDTLAEAAPQLAELQITCAPSECSVTADGRVVSQLDAKTMRVFLEPGTHQVGASFKSGSVSKKIDGKKGAREELVFEAPAEPVPASPPPATPTAPAPTQPPPAAEAPRSHKPFGPLVFWIGAGLTVAAGGVTVWSGIDTQNNPGTDRVRAECAGKDESCPAYAEGRASQLRTNVFVAATSVLAVGTVAIGVFFTDWGGGKKAGASRLVDLAVGPTSAAVVGRF